MFSQLCIVRLTCLRMQVGVFICSVVNLLIRLPLALEILVGIWKSCRINGFHTAGTNLHFFYQRGESVG